MQVNVHLNVQHSNVFVAKLEAHKISHPYLWDGKRRYVLRTAIGCLTEIEKSHEHEKEFMTREKEHRLRPTTIEETLVLNIDATKPRVMPPSPPACQTIVDILRNDHVQAREKGKTKSDTFKKEVIKEERRWTERENLNEFFAGPTETKEAAAAATTSPDP
ncbi:hypothetical protein LSAT2_017693 [Lamellibrachia satsuma]|nr:hypothetical protein LSAT2_017693 [Lamellibrachia satsuma]